MFLHAAKTTFWAIVAENHLKDGHPIPLDVFAKCLEHGVDINEIARKYPNNG